jgi:CheY-like chemotaxis protein
MKSAPFEILLVDDDADDVVLTSRMLESGTVDVRVRTAANGAEALALLRRADASEPRPELILLDVHMPVMSGPELLRELKADALLKSIAVVLLTTSAARQLDAGRGPGADAYVEKPFGMDQAGPLNDLIKDFSERGLNQ